LKYRRITLDWFAPQKLQALEARIRVIAREAVERMASHGSECDFARDVGLLYPLRVVMEILGVPEQDEPLMLKLTQEILGSEDEDLRRDARAAGDPAAQLSQFMDVVADFETYFAELTEARRKDPRDDVASIIAHAKIDGAVMGHTEAMSYYVIIATAGHDTTSSSTSGAIWALCEHPGEFRKVKADRSLVPKLVEEAVRYTTPVRHFMRSATADTQIRGRTIAEGDRLMLCYPSGNRDEEVFQTRTYSVSTAMRRGMSLLAMAAMSVWASTSCAWRCASSSRSCWKDLNRSNSPARRAVRPQRLSVDRRPCRSGSKSTERRSPHLIANLIHQTGDATGHHQDPPYGIFLYGFFLPHARGRISLSAAST